MNTPILKRFPPGDRWTPYEDNENSVVFNTLTEALNWAFKETGSKNFVVDAESGLVSIYMKEVLKSTSSYEIYGE